MLIEFNVKNFRSFWETQTLNLVASSLSELQENNTIRPKTNSLPRLLRSAVVYGPNGAGKSNLITALHFMKEFILSSSKESQEGETIKRKSFLLHSNGPNESSVMEVIFIEGDVRYQYGFAVTNQRVVQEWLLAYPENRAQRWFERSYNPDTKQEQWLFGSKFTGPKKLWKEATRSNALFLSTAVQLNNDQLKPIYSWFQKLAIIRHGQLINPEFTIRTCQDKESCQRILDFMNGADLSIDGIDVTEKKITQEQLKLPSDMPIDLQKIIKKDIIDTTFYKVEFVHQNREIGFTVSLPLEEESDGTQKLFAYAAPWLDVLDNGLVLVVDELDNSLHPHIVRFLLQLIQNSTTNKKGGQLIFSTHDTSILDQNILRRDQIWFIEKDSMQASQLYPLSDFHPRKGEALEKGYLQGRFGALPYIGEVNF